MTKAYRLFEVSDDGYPRTLKHGHQGSRTLPVGEPLEAEVKHVWNPGKKTGPGYISGWHVTFSKSDAEVYINQFKKRDSLVVCPVYVSDYQPKPRSPHSMYLARWLYIDPADWKSIIEGDKCLFVKGLTMTVEYARVGLASEWRDERCRLENHSAAHTSVGLGGKR